ncbi:FKBP-type peptidyl-prolyl cis-trans isomerase FklB [Chitinophaga costaii]|uniref:Peptidyl-prolyl cis-trans isomerase n=1 Tax=Chitinophaga costaii TaxID=1335309 RepID=A0A1C3ZCQ5_9BACT|nr:FKBP-type peptidyl-prolyl cis-trans isomerase [Chitinophaga costaii]PUZ30317.1 FKBP-type peptidyl-prolyl cis-trans isomerase [Chitinophaga costaii]SCB80076.1 FKBP-type peptidyl-prolyl cis-trans isomerase FklB [Chitinophaga costaii]
MMKKYLLLGALGMIAAQGFAQTKAKQAVKRPVATSPLLKTSLDSVSYAIGQDIANNFKAQGLDNINTAILIKSIQDALKSKTPLLTKTQSDMSISNYLQQLKGEKAKKNKEAGEKFLAENKTKPGVVTLPSGLEYQILKEGTGAKPTINDKVKTHYHGTLLDGTVFDSSVERGEPISFPVSGVIKGWTEALQLMPVGSKWKLFIPADLAYGDRQAGPKIGPGSTLIFEVELLSIEQ